VLVVLLALLALAVAFSGLAGRGASVTPERYASVRFGMTLAEARAAYGVPLLPLAPILDPELGCYFVSAHGLADAPHWMVFDGRVVRIDVRSPGLLADAGVGVGSLESDVLAVYGARAQVSPHKYTGPAGHYVTVDAGEHAIVFETDGTRVTRYRAGRKPEVTWVEGCS
jgi:hypothetical protein